MFFLTRALRVILCLLTFGACLAAPAVAADDQTYAGLLRDHVRDGLVDYAALKTDVRLPAYIAALEQIELAPLSREERLAYWINTYNAVTLKLMADAWPVASIMEINAGKPWDLPLFTPQGADAPITLNHLEHVIIRKQFDEPRIHFALVCAAVSCPPLISEPYAAATLEQQLERQTRAFAQDQRRNRYDRAAHTLRLSPLFDWYAADFGGSAKVLAYLRPYLSESDRRALEEKGTAPTVVFTDYDWAPNAAK